jgi:hypothetical protein
MTEEEINKKYADGIEKLQGLEAIIKGQKAKFPKHLERIALLQFFVERIAELKALELNSLAVSNVPPLDEPPSE